MHGLAILTLALPPFFSFLLYLTCFYELRPLPSPISCSYQLDPPFALTNASSTSPINSYMSPSLVLQPFHHIPLIPFSSFVCFVPFFSLPLSHSFQLKLYPTFTFSPSLLPASCSNPSHFSTSHKPHSLPSPSLPFSSIPPSNTGPRNFTPPPPSSSFFCYPHLPIPPHSLILYLPLLSPSSAIPSPPAPSLVMFR